jgi:hypothetical protein
MIPVDLNPVFNDDDLCFMVNVLLSSCTFKIASKKITNIIRFSTATGANYSLSIPPQNCVILHDTGYFKHNTRSFLKVRLSVSCPTFASLLLIPAGPGVASALAINLPLSHIHIKLRSLSLHCRESAGMLCIVFNRQMRFTRRSLGQSV